MSVDLTPELVDAIVTLSKRAGETIMEIYRTDFAVKTKSDNSPVTHADEQAEALILSELNQLTPGIPQIAEEDYAAGNRQDVSGGVYWLIDALDGTKEFLKKTDEFTVNIALVEHGDPVFGVVHAPAKGDTYWGGPGGAFMQSGEDAPQAISTAVPADDGLRVLTSRSHYSGEAEFLADVKVKEELHSGSSIKFCLVASGVADLYPRLGPTNEWDIGAGDAVLRAAGGIVVTMDGEPMRYQKENFKNPYFIARGQPA